MGKAAHNSKLGLSGHFFDIKQYGIRIEFCGYGATSGSKANSNKQSPPVNAKKLTL